MEAVYTRKYGRKRNIISKNGTNDAVEQLRQRTFAVVYTDRLSLAIPVASDPLSQGMVVVQQGGVGVVVCERGGLVVFADGSHRAQTQLRLVGHGRSGRRVRHDRRLQTGHAGLHVRASASAAAAAAATAAAAEQLVVRQRFLKQISLAEYNVLVVNTT